jgi:hypothetical protein
MATPILHSLQQCLYAIRYRLGILHTKKDIVNG